MIKNVLVLCSLHDPPKDDARRMDLSLRSLLLMVAKYFPGVWEGPIPDQHEREC